MKKYERYKDSGVQWLGKVPEHWEVMPMKRGLNIHNGQDYKHIESREGYPVIGSGGQFTWAKDYLHDGEAVLLGRKGTIDKPRYINGKFWTVDTMFYAVPFEDVSCKYMYYQALEIPFDLYSTNTAVPSMTQSDLANNPFCFPPLSEQHAIVAYLDSQVSKINSVITEKEKMINEMEKYRSSLISETVTKGLNPDAPMKDSGVDWIGEIPEHWEVIRIGLVYPGIGSGTTPDSGNTLYYTEKGYSWLQTGDLTDGDICETSKHITDFAMKDKGLRMYPEGSIVIAMYGATIGKVGYLRIPTTTNQACCVLPPNKNSFSRFTLYLMLAIKNKLISLSVGGGQPNISQAIIKEQRIPTPPIGEQEQIASFLDSQTSKIDSLVSELKFQIEDLKSYKQSLITDAVTGQVDVRDWTPNE